MSHFLKRESSFSDLYKPIAWFWEPKEVAYYLSGSIGFFLYCNQVYQRINIDKCESDELYILWTKQMRKNPSNVQVKFLTSFCQRDSS